MFEHISYHKFSKTTAGNGKVSICSAKGRPRFLSGVRSGLGSGSLWHIRDRI